MIILPSNIGELNMLVFPYYALTNVVSAYRAYQLPGLNYWVRVWLVIGLAGGAAGHYFDFLNGFMHDGKQLSGKNEEPAQWQQIFGFFAFAVPSLLGIVGIWKLYIDQVIGWTSEAYVILVLGFATIAFDASQVSGWASSFQW